MDVIGLADDSVLRDDPSEESPSEDNPTDECDWLNRCFRLKFRPKDALKPFDSLSRCFRLVRRGVRLVVLPDEYDWTSGAPCLFLVNAT